MMIKEFVERTGYQPDDNEYHYIEESYYEFTGQKDEFCEQWKKERASGRWQTELKFRKALDEALATQKAKYEKQLAEQEALLEFYRSQYDEYVNAKTLNVALKTCLRGLAKDIEKLL